MNNFITDFFLFLIRWLYSIVNNYAIAIIILTILMRLIMLPLDVRQRKSSMKMAAIQPELDSLKKRFSNDPQALQKKQQELMKKAGAQPLAGCLPALLQLPIFFAFFGALRVIAAEQSMAILLQAAMSGADSAKLPGFLWVHNMWQPDSGSAGILPSATEFLTFIQTNSAHLSAQNLALLQRFSYISFNSGTLIVNADAYNTATNAIITANGFGSFKNGWYILPILAGGSMFFQQWLTSRGNAQMQQQGKFMMYIFPAVSFFICLSSNTVFALYWFTSNAYAVIQQLIITAITNKKEAKKKEEMRTLSTK